MRPLLIAGMSAAVVAACSDGPAAPRPPTTLSIDAKEHFVLVGETVSIEITTEGGSTSAVVWESLDPHVATVSDGLVTGVTRGNARILARAGSQADTARVGVARNSFNVSTTDFCENPRFAPVRIAAVGERVIILADTRDPAGGFSDSDFRGFASQFDAAIYPTITTAFGEPLDVDDNDRLIVLFTGAVNELAEDPEEGFVAGFVWARDLLPRTPRTVLGLSFLEGCPGSNEAELTYLAIPDPAWPQGLRNLIRRTPTSPPSHTSSST